MILLHLHQAEWDAPFRIPPLEVELLPTGVAQLLRPDENEREELEGNFRGRLPLVGVNRPEQLADAQRFRDRRPVLGHDRRQRVLQIQSRVSLGSAGREGIAEDLAGAALGLVGRLVRAPGLDALQRSQEIARLYLPNRSGAHRRPQELQQLPAGFPERDRR